MTASVPVKVSIRVFKDIFQLLCAGIICKNLGPFRNITGFGSSFIEKTQKYEKIPRSKGALVLSEFKAQAQ